MPQRPVAQICNLLYRRIVFGSSSPWARPHERTSPSGLKIRDTAECNSALRWWCRVAPLRVGAQFLALSEIGDGLGYRRSHALDRPSGKDTDNATSTHASARIQLAKPDRRSVGETELHYLWTQLFYSALKNGEAGTSGGRAGFVMANSASDARASEQEIRQKLIESRTVDVMVAVGPNLFYTVMPEHPDGSNLLEELKLAV